MALSDIEQVRMGIGDITIPYILSDEQIQHYLDSNSDSVSDTTDELQPIVLSALASQGNANRIEEIWEDTSGRAADYERALKASDLSFARKASPIIGGSMVASQFSVDQFDPTDWGV